MARTEITPQALDSRAGVTGSYTTVGADGVAVKNTKKNVLIHMKNSDASPVTMTFQIAKTVDGQSVTDKTATLVASGSPGDEKFFGPFEPTVYNQSDALVNIDAGTNDVVTVAALTFG